jgi:hypothetical protein
MPEGGNKGLVGRWGVGPFFYLYLPRSQPANNAAAIAVAACRSIEKLPEKKGS